MNGSTRPCSATSTSSHSPTRSPSCRLRVYAFDCIYNTERPHRGLPGRVTPQQAWDATAKVDAPRPKPGPPRFKKPASLKQPTPILAELSPGTTVRQLNSAGTFRLDKVTYIVGGQHNFQHVLVVTHGDKIIVTELDGVIFIEHNRPAPGVTYVGNGRPRGPRPKTNQPSPKS